MKWTGLTPIVDFKIVKNCYFLANYINETKLNKHVNKELFGIICVYGIFQSD